MSSRQGLVGGPFKLNVSANSFPTYSRTIIVPPEMFLETMEDLLGTGGYVPMFGGLFLRNVGVKGVGKVSGTLSENPSLSEILDFLPLYGEGNTTARGGYELELEFTNDPAQAVSSSSSSSASGASARNTFRPDSGGIVTITRDYTTEAYNVSRIDFSKWKITGNPDFYVPKYIGNVVYTFNWKRPPAINWELMDQAVKRANEKEFPMPVYNKVIEPMHLLFEGCTETLDITFEGGEFRTSQSVKMDFVERLGYSWENYFYLEETPELDENGNHVVEFKELNITGVILAFDFMRLFRE